MKWMGKEIHYKEDWAAAMQSLNTPDDARVFLDAAREYEPIHWKELLGYLLGDVHPEERERVKNLLSVEYPFDPNLSIEEMLVKGIEMGNKVRNGEGLPEWMQLVFKIPRRSWKLTFEET